MNAKDSRPAAPSIPVGTAIPLTFALTMLLALWAIGQEFLQGYTLDLGRALNTPPPRFGRFIGLWMFFGTLAVAGFTLALGRLVSARRSLEGRLREGWSQGTDRKWLFYGMAFAFLIPSALRTLVLGGTPLTDDESAYRLMAELLASGRVYGDSPPQKLFFDNRFLINDGKVYAHYFLGWPALLAPGVWLGITGFMNAIYSALTVPALWASLKRLFGSAWARLGLLIYLTSPMLMIAAATETAHTTCVMALIWMTWFWLRSREDAAPWWSHGGFALAFSVAFFNRPTSALGIGLPLLILWIVHTLRHPGRIRALTAFAIPAGILAALFLGVNLAQTGSPLEVAYQRAFTYAQENDFRFSLWPYEAGEEGFTELNFSGPMRSLAVAAAALFRFSITFLGWPCSILLAFFAGRRGVMGWMWLSVLTYFAVHLVTDNVGIDTFAPMHYFELAGPFLLLTVGGLVQLTRLGERLDVELPDLVRGLRARTLPIALLLSLIVVATLAYVPVRFNAIHRIATNIRMPFDRLAEAGIDRAVIFAPEPFIYYCLSAPTSGWVFVRPNNDPELQNDLIWANHLTLEKNKDLMHQFPDRPGYVMGWDRSCQVNFVPLDQVPPGAIPDAKLPHFRDLDAAP